VEPAPAGLAAELDDVVFSFPDDPRPALDHVSMRIERGRVVAIVGPTGAGKSTLVELLAGLVAPTSGTVRRAPGPVAIVFQEAFLFSGTIRHNLELGRRHADEDLWDALALAEGAEFVGETPHQLDTVVGERGVSLSGGQRQRVALARALLRRPDLLLLDDTTSALDPATEAAVLANLRQGLAGTTVVMVASRPSTIALADEVMYLAGGRLVAHGPHAALMAAHDGYRSLVEAFESERAEDEEAVGAGVRRD
jgi:ABC-type multidrug transport system fused ATPase/permease subunit